MRNSLASLLLVLSACKMGDVQSSAKATEPVAAKVGPIQDVDLAMLLPLVAFDFTKPDLGFANYMFKPSDVGALGELLPMDFLEAVYTQAFAETEFTSNSKLLHQFLPVTHEDASRFGGIWFFLREEPMFPVALRFDPCFPMLSTDDSQCTRQLRIIWQASGHNDAAIHTLYTLSKESFDKAIAELIRLKKASGMTYDGRLDVHPILAKEGINGPFATGLVALIKSIAGKDNIATVTFMTLAPGGAAGLDPGPWRFGALDNHNGHLEPRPILSTKFYNQDIVGFNGRSRSFDKDSLLNILIQPSLGPVDDRFHLLDVAQVATEIVLSESESIGAQSPADFDKSYDFLLATANPHLTSFITNACADCHVGPQTAAALEWARPELKAKTMANRFLPEIAIDANLGDPGHTLSSNNFHNFGYFKGSHGITKSISQRVSNEARVVTEWVNKDLADK